MSRLNSEQLRGITATNLQAICFRDSNVIEPLRGDGRVLERVIDRVKNAVRPDFHHHFGECLCTEIAARSYVEVLSQIVANGKLGSWFVTQCS